jgi:pimeloyl-ACP methyl ester carboxylesterase
VADDGILSYTSVYERGVPPPQRWALVLHGILGTKANWRGVMRRVVAARPAWGALLVDLRNHGESKRGFAPPDTVAAAAADLERLVAHAGLHVDAVIGHSYGGKVALALAGRWRGEVDHVVVVDSAPGARADARGSEGTVAVVDLLAGLPRRHQSRESFVEAVVGAGHAREMATWLAMNLERDGDGFVLAIDPARIRAMLDDYFAVDLWFLLEELPGRMTVDVLVGGRSGVLSAADRERLGRLAAAHPARLRVSVVPDAGHWVHVDAPEATVDHLLRALSA